MTIKEMESMLKNYTDQKRQLELLENEITYFSGITYNEMIESCCFTSGYKQPELAATSQKTNTVSDKTGQVALMYRELTEQKNTCLLRELVKEYADLSARIKMLELRVHHLDSRSCAIIMGLYFEGKSWAELCQEFYISTSMLGRERKKAVSELARLC